MKILSTFALNIPNALSLEAFYFYTSEPLEFLFFLFRFICVACSSAAQSLSNCIKTAFPPSFPVSKFEHRDFGSLCFRLTLLFFFIFIPFLFILILFSFFHCSLHTFRARVEMFSADNRTKFSLGVSSIRQGREAKKSCSFSFLKFRT